MGNSTAIELAKNKRRVFDQTASMHFKLSDEYKRKYIIEDAVEIIVSIILCGVTFLDYNKFFHISEESSTLIIGFTSIFLLSFTLVKQGLSHKQLYEKYQLAGKMYAQAKIEITSKIAAWQEVGASDAEILEYINSHFSSLNDLPQIPEKHFNRLKHAHQYKIALSKYLDTHQNDLWTIILIKFWLKKE